MAIQTYESLSGMTPISTGNGTYMKVVDHAAEVERLRAEVKALSAHNERLAAYREWLRDGFREIYQGKNEAAHADHYRQYAEDTLGGPTGETLQTIIAARAARAALEARR